MQTSRQTISRLADYAELAQQKTKEQLHRIQQQLLEEKARAEESERKLKMFQVCINWPTVLYKTYMCSFEIVFLLFNKRRDNSLAVEI